MLTLFKSLVLPRLDYGSQLWSPHLVKHIDQLEKIQRSFSKHITGMQSLEYSERLVSLKLYSLQRRRERYCIIYVWKIIEGLVPNFSKPIVCSYSERRGRSCIISHVNLGRLGSIAYNSLRWRAIRLFNAMPKYIKCISSFSVVSFKSKLFNYSLTGQVLEEVMDAKYLGVTLSNDLEWSKHIATMTNKANSKLSFLRCNQKGCPEKLKQTAYFSLVRSFMEYGATVWYPYQKYNSDKIERVQRRAARFVKSRYSRYSSVSDMLDVLGWTPLSQRRQEARLILFYKIINGH